MFASAFFYPIQNSFDFAGERVIFLLCECVLLFKACLSLGKIIWFYNKIFRNAVAETETTGAGNIFCFQEEYTNFVLHNRCHS